MTELDMLNLIADELNLKRIQVKNTVELLDAGNTSAVRRKANAATVVAANIERRTTGRQYGRCPAAASARCPGQVIRIVRDTVNGVAGLVGER